MKQLINKSVFLVFIGSLLLGLSTSSFAGFYRIDTLGGHASVNFKIKHLGYSWLTGRFDKFAGSFNYDEKAPEKSKVSITVKTNSIDSAHALRDTHLRGAKYLNVRKFPEARFVSDSYTPINKNTARLTGKFSLHGVTKNITTTVTRIGGGKDPWGGYRQGFETHFSILLTDYEIKHKLGVASNELQLSIYVEGAKESLEDGTPTK